MEETRPHKQSSLPFLWLDSQQTKQRTVGHSQFPLFIKRMERTKAQNGTFTCYGLSQSMPNKELIAMVPHF
ncbi:type I-F CRISPR-associated endoribonuclease Cas6/Csy4 [Arsenophonus endosymbiont of Aleurodicus floccissimus]|uniref:type I-F CRISPR-associated endoribonuclease Cas6/Csy4 n=1 Tax=Arsenophonus endosymbiont of Aleurodicus floccissimus TaxID=2152761 RepID=UPI002103789C|nr:type I-F CRISPR-associated endoribonuclease Cas6/Csy4 [Arsenophonus endosymbiont of Aleurodicus floccissimus]